MNWFEDLTGFTEEEYHITQTKLHMQGETLICLPNQKKYQSGLLLMPTLAVLRQQTLELTQNSTPNQLSEWVGDVQLLHQDPSNQDAVFQVASQFNLLEMVSPNVTPLEGITNYEYDKTQGPACAIACGAGTIFRNYAVNVAGQHGQTDRHQLNMLDELEQAVNNKAFGFWLMQNGYVIPTKKGLSSFNIYLSNLTTNEYEHLKSLIKVGLQQNTQVTLNNATHCVSQVYCSALPLAYLNFKDELWQPFAKMVLETAYEATFHHALLERKRTGNRRIFLTLLGGGAFGNPIGWVIQAIEKALNQFANCDLEIIFVSYGQSNSSLQHLIQKYTVSSD